MSLPRRLQLALLGLLLAAVAAPVLLAPTPPNPAAPRPAPAPPTSPAEDARRRVALAGLSPLPPAARAAPSDPGSLARAREILARGYADEAIEGAHEAGPDAPLALFLGLLAGCALALAAAFGRRLDDDLALVAARLEGAAAGPAGLALRESVALDEALARALPRAPTEADPAAPDDGEEERRQNFQIVAGMSHDLRSPLNSILGFAELLRQGEGGPLADGARAPLEALRRAGRRLLSLVTQILDTARYQAGRLTLERRPTLVAGLLRDAVSQLGRTMDLPPDVELRPELPPGLPAVVVDRMRIAEALALLLGEAATHAGPGVVRLVASERPAGDDQPLVLEIEAPGPLPPEGDTTLSGLFRTRAPADLGMAVPLARALIELHGGALRTDDGPPGRFVITLPASASAGGTDAPLDEPRPPRS